MAGEHGQTGQHQKGGGSLGRGWELEEGEREGKGGEGGGRRGREGAQRPYIIETINSYTLPM